MTILRNFIMFFGGIIMMVLAFTFGAIIFVVLALIGLAFWGYFKLNKKNIINNINQMGMGREPESSTIDGDYEVVDAEFEVLEEKEPVKKD